MTRPKLYPPATDRTADADARTLVAQLREETAYGLNLERVLRDLTETERSTLHTLTRKARAARCGSKTLGELLNG